MSVVVTAVVSVLVGYALGRRRAARALRRLAELEAERGYLIDLVAAAERRETALRERAESAEIDAAAKEREAEKLVRIVWVPLMNAPEGLQ